MSMRWDIQADSGLLHEDEATVLIARAAAGRNIEVSEPNEGKVELRRRSRAAEDRPRGPL